MNIYAVFPLAASVIYIVLFVLLVIHHPWHRRQKYFSGFIVGALTWSVSDVFFRSDYFLDYKLLLARITVCSFIFMLVFFCYFVSTFYEYGKSSWIFLAYISLVSNIGLAIFGYQPSGVEGSVSFYPLYNMPLLVVFTVIPFVSIAARAYYLLFRRLVLAENALIHTQLMYLILTISVLFVSIMSNVIPIGRELPISHIGNLIAAIVLAYAIIRHQLLDLKFVLWRSLVFFGVTVFVAVSYLIILIIFQTWFQSRIGTASITFTIVFAGLLVASIYPLRKVLQAMAERLLYPGTYNYRKTLVEFSRKASSIIDIDKLGQEFTTLIVSALSAKKAYLLLADNVNSDLRVRFTIPESEDGSYTQFIIRKDSPIVDWLKQHDKPLFREELKTAPEFSSLWGDEHEAIQRSEAELFLPLLSRGNLVGIMILTRKDPMGTYDMGDIQLVSLLTYETAIALENAQLHAEIALQSITDSLTQLFNRRYFDKCLREEILRGSRYGGKFSLAILDIDRFKNYNDSKGHLAGDVLLTDIARALKTSLRNTDLCFRYGGDEFAVLLPEAGVDDAQTTLERFQRKFSAINDVVSDSTTMSIGIALWPVHGTTYDEIIRAADSSLYSSKQNGGNSISTYSKLVTPLPLITAAEIVDDKEVKGIISSLTGAMEVRDRDTYKHSYNVAAWSVMLAKALGLKKEDVNTLYVSALLHDVGKIAISDEVLQKPGALDVDQWKIIKSHPRIGVEIISKTPKLSNCIPVVLHHHENYDGTGYPDGLKGDAIPLLSRILLVADAFTAMASSRSYRDVLTFDKAIEQLKLGSGRQFDPELIEAFLKIAKLEYYNYVR